MCRTDGRTGHEARPDIRVRGVWSKGQNAFLDIRLTNVNASSQKIKLSKQYRKSTKKKRADNSHMNVEHGHPLH